MDTPGVIASALLALLVGFLMGSCEANADDTWASATLASYHTNRHAEHNERNWGLGVERNWTGSWRAVGGAYDNSYSRLSIYGGGLYLRPFAGPVKLGGLVGISTGYDRVVGPFAPVAMPIIAIEGKQFGVNIGIMPSLKHGIGVIGLQVKTRF